MRVVNWFLVVIFWLLFHTVVSGQYWQRSNPGGGGWMMSVGAGPTGTILVGSDLSGAYRSTDGGTSWDVIGYAAGLTATHVGAVGFDPANGEILYLGTNAGIFRSEDGGDHVTHVFDPGLPGRAIGDIEIAANDPNIGYATYQPAWNGLGGVVYKTTDRGLNWAQVSLDLPDDLRLLKLVIDPNDAETLYVLSGFDRFACGPAELYKSSNGGINWTQLAPDLSETWQIMDVAVDPQHPEVLYLTTMNVPCNSAVAYEGDIYKSTDGGDTWFDPNPAVERSGVIWIKRDEPDVIRLIDVRKTAPWIPSSGTFTSMDGGVNWTQTGFETDWGAGYLAGFNEDLGTVIHRSYGNNKNYCKTLGTDMSDPDKMYWVNTRFVYGTEDGGTHFNNLFTDQVASGGWQSRGVDNVILHDIEISEVNPNIVYAGYADNGLWRSLDAGMSWESCNVPTYTEGWAGFGGNTYCIAPDPERANVVWAAMQGTNNCHLVRSDATGEISSWVLSNEGLPTSLRITDMAVDRNSNMHNRTLFAVVSGNVYKSTDDGYSWSISSSDVDVWFVEVDPGNSDVVYAGGSGGCYRSSNGGLSWSATGLDEMSGTGNTADFWRKSYRGISSIYPSSCEPGIVYATAYGPGKGLYKSTDYGESWSKMLDGDYMRSVVVSENNHQVIFTGSSYIGYSGGIANFEPVAFQYSLDGGLTWVVDEAELDYPSIVSMELNHANPEKLFIASQGTGIQWAYDWIVPFTYYADIDNDTFGNVFNSLDTCISFAPVGYTLNDEDCDDLNPDIHPNAAEIPDNGIDENCDGQDLLTGLVNHTSLVAVEVFPNPFTREITIASTLDEVVEVALINVLGQTVFEQSLQTLDRRVSLDVAELAAGIYWMKIYSPNGEIIAIKQVQKE